MKRFTRPTSKEEERLNNFDINKHVQKYKGTSYFTEQLDNGRFVYADRFTLIREAHSLMKNYGMGGCKSFTEYVEMVNQEDPVIIDTLLAIQTEDARCEAGFKPREINLGDDLFEPVERVKSIDIKKFSEKSADIAQSPVMGLISNFGSSYGETQKMIEDRRTEVGGFSKDTFDDITTDSINEPGFDLKSALERLKDAKKRSLNIEITPSMWSSGKMKKK